LRHDDATARNLWNFSVFGSKRTSVFGLVADSLAGRA
jgi:hypothetical protein